MSTTTDQPVARLGRPDEILAVLHDAEAAVARVPRPTTYGERAAWEAVLRASQRVVNAAAAVQDAAIARLAAVESELLEDGTVVESHRAPGHVALDAPAIVSGALTVSAAHAERRVRVAVALAGDGPGSGLGGLHESMRAGRLDPYRAGVLAQELEHAPAQVRASVVAALEGYFRVEDAAQLRRRCRRVLARVSPDLLVQRARRARAESGLRRWAEEPGVDRWEGSFPSEEAAAAWAAVDALARQYITDGLCPTIERARAKALTDLVAGNATIHTVITLTVPAETVAAGPAPGHDRTAAGEDTSAGGHPDDEPARMSCEPEDAPRSTSGRDDGAHSSSELDDRIGSEGTASRIGSEGTAAHIWSEGAATPAGHVASDGAASRIACQSVHAGSGDPEPSLAGDSCGPGAAAAGSADQDERDDPLRGEDLVEVGGLRAGENVLVPRGWVTATLASPRVSVRTASCHRETGALLGDDGGSESSGYRPGRRLVALVRQRDGRCRFPGCAVAARYCDLDHVRPWPAGPTTAENLACLCRRHHRVKQRPGWRVTVTGGAVLTWTSPTGQVRTSLPVDALHTLTLPAPASAMPHPPASRARTVLPDGPHTALEFLLEHHGAAPSTCHPRRPPPIPTGHRRRRHDSHPAPTTPGAAPRLHIDPDSGWPHSRGPTSHRRDTTTPPPF